MIMMNFYSIILEGYGNHISRSYQFHILVTSLVVGYLRYHRKYVYDEFDPVLSENYNIVINCSISCPYVYVILLVHTHISRYKFIFVLLSEHY